MSEGAREWTAEDVAADLRGAIDVSDDGAAVHLSVPFLSPFEGRLLSVRFERPAEGRWRATVDIRDILSCRDPDGVDRDLVEAMAAEHAEANSVRWAGGMFSLDVPKAHESGDALWTATWVATAAIDLLTALDPAP